MRVILVLASLCCMLETSRASDLTDLMRSKSSLDLELKLSARESLLTARANCERELSGTELPRHCFESLDLEMRLVKLSREKAEHERAWLTRVCVKRARAAARVEMLRETSTLPASCRAEADRRREDLEYRMEEEDPRRLMESIRTPDDWTGS